MSNPSCLAPKVLAAYVDGSLANPDALAVEQHVERCADCLRRLEEAERNPGGELQALRLVRAHVAMGAERSDLDVVHLGGAPRRGGLPPSPGPKCDRAAFRGTGDPLEETRQVTAAEIDTSLTADMPLPSMRRIPQAIADLALDKQPVVFGRYQLEKKLGEGGMGAIFLATDTVLGRKVSIKIPFSSSTRQRQDVMARFRREARCAAALEHPNICAVYDVGEIDGQPYMAMAYVSGKPLSDFIKAKDDIPVKGALQVACRLAKTLDYAHSRGVLHRDLKPSNVMFSDRNEPVVMDFGLARLETDHKREPLTRSGDIVGTPAYMPPEQLAGRHSEMGPWSDVYSLGVILYQLLTKHRPFDGDLFELVHKIANEGAAPPSRRRPEVDARLDALVLKCLEKSPQARFSSMSQLAAALDDCLKAVPGGAAQSVSQSMSMSAAADNPTLSASRPAPPTLPLNRSAGTEEAMQSGRQTPSVPTEGALPQTGRRASSTFVSRGGSAPSAAEATSPAETPDERASNTMRSGAVAPEENPVDCFAEVSDIFVRTRPAARKSSAARESGRQFGPGVSRSRLAVAALGVLLLLGIVLFVRTPKGTLRVELKDPTVEVRVQGENVTLTGGDPKPVRLTPGEKSFIVKRGTFQFETKSLVLRKNETVIARVEIFEGDLRVTADGREIGRATLPKPAAIAPEIPNALSARPNETGSNSSPSKILSTAPRTAWPAGAPSPAVAPFNAPQAKLHQEEWAAYLKVPVECENSLGMKLRLVPPGSYLRGASPGDLREIAAMRERYPNDLNADRTASESPRHGVAIDRPLYVGVHEVTQKAYEEIMGKNPSTFSRGGDGAKAVEGMDTTAFPVESITAADAAEFCIRLSEREKRRPAYVRAGDTWTIRDAEGYRLPTEAEWEYFCRAGTTSIFWSGDKNEDVAVSDCVGAYPYTHEQRAYLVGQRAANPFGVFDVHGNVRELCQDAWDANAYAHRGEVSRELVDFRAPRTARGGCYIFSPFVARSAARVPALHPMGMIGFRVVLPIAADRSFPVSVPNIPASESAPASAKGAE